MVDDSAFRDLIRRVRAGNQEAAAQLVKLYEPEILRVIRLKMTNPYLRRTINASDICQSVLANFFVRVAAGQFDLEEPIQLIKLLVTMARNKIVDHSRKPANRMPVDGGSALWAQVAGSDECPSQVVAQDELLQEVRRRMTDDERVVAELRAEGRSWQEIAALRGGTPDAHRKKVERALDRVCRELGIDRVGHAGSGGTDQG